MCIVILQDGLHSSSVPSKAEFSYPVECHDIHLLSAHCWQIVGILEELLHLHMLLLACVHCTYLSLFGKLSMAKHVSYGSFPPALLPAHSATNVKAC